MIAESSIKTSKTRPPVEIGFLIEEETVSQLRARPEQSAAESLDFRLLGMVLCQEGDERADEIDAQGRDEDGSEMVAQAPVRRRARARHVVDLPGRSAHNVSHGGLSRDARRLLCEKARDEALAEDRFRVTAPGHEEIVQGFEQARARAHELAAQLG